MKSLKNRSNEIRGNEIRSNEIRSNEIHIRREPSVLTRLGIGSNVAGISTCILPETNILA